MDDKEKKIMEDEKLTSKQLLGELLQKHYAEAMEANLLYGPPRLHLKNF